LRHALSVVGRGDSIILRRGDIFAAEDLSVPSGVTSRSAPGRGPKAILTAARPVSGWAAESATLAVATLPTALACFDDTGWLTRARFPDAGWLRTAKGTSGERIVPAEALGWRAVDVKGATIRWRRWSWFYETRRVVATDASGALQLADRDFKAPDQVGIGSGFYLESPHALDAEGEWWHDRDQLRLYTEELPEDGSIWAITAGSALELASGSRLEDLEFRGYGPGAVVTIAATAVVINCDFRYVIGTAISGSWNAAGSLIAGNRFEDILTNGITWNENRAGSGGTVIRDNIFLRIGAEPGRGASGTWKASGIIVSNGSVDPERSVLIRGNRFDTIGYAGVILGADNQRVERNLLRRCIATHNDGAAIYTNSHGNHISENIVLDTIGDLDSSQPWYPLGHGIWPEFLSEFKDHGIHGNTIFGSGGHGIFLPNNRSATISDNTIVSNRLAALHLGGHERKGSNRVQGHTITDNLLAIGGRPYRPPADEQLAQWNHLGDHQRLLSFEPDIDYGVISGTTLLLPDPKLPPIRQDRDILALDAWTSAFPWADADPDTRLGHLVLLINDSDSPVRMKAPRGSWRSLTGERIRAQVLVQPWRSVSILPKRPLSSTVSGYYLASEQGK
jgi:parallel beta-helix repeat protein